MIVSRKEYFDKIKAGIVEAASIVSKTLGPNGHTVMLFKDSGKPYLTKDGISVLRTIKDPDPIKNGTISLLKDAVEKMTLLAGDGSTTCTILCNALISGCLDLLSDSRPPSYIIKNLNLFLETTIKQLKSRSKNVSPNDVAILNVAKTATNNDLSLAKIIAKAFKKVGKQGHIIFDVSEDENSSLEIIDGLTFNSPIPSDGFINNFVKSCAEYNDAYVLLINSMVSNLNEIRNCIGFAVNKNKPLLIVAQKYNEQVIKDILKNNISGVTNIIAVQADGYGNYSKLECLKNISAITGAKIIDSVNCAVPNDFGICKRVEANLYKTTIARNEAAVDEKLYNERVKELTEKINIEKNLAKKTSLKEQRANLTGKMAIIHVGGETYADMKEKYDRVEDAINAVRSTLEEGYVAGGGISLLKLTLPGVAEGDNDLLHMLYHVLNSVFFQHENNSDIDSFTFNEFERTEFDNNNDYGFDFNKKEWCNLVERGIIDPTKVLRVALEQSINITRLLLNSIGSVTNEYNKDEFPKLTF